MVEAISLGVGVFCSRAEFHGEQVGSWAEEIPEERRDPPGASSSHKRMDDKAGTGVMVANSHSLKRQPWGAPVTRAWHVSQGMVWQLVQEGTQRGHLFEGGTFHWLSGKTWSPHNPATVTILWPCLQVKDTHPTWSSRQNAGYSCSSA